MKKQGKQFIFDTQITTHAIVLTNSNAVNILNNAKAFLEMQQYVFDLYCLDKLCTVYDVYNIESDALGQKMKYFQNDLPSVDVTEPLIKEKSDIHKIKNIDFKRNYRCRFVLDLIDIYKEKIGKDFKPRFCAPFSLAANIRGFENLINDIYEDMRFTAEFFKIINYEILAPWISIQKERVGNKNIIASGADAWVTIPNVNLKIMEDIIIPSFKELEGIAGNIYLSVLGGARFLKHPENYLELQKIINPFLVKGFDPDVEVLGPGFFSKFAEKNNMGLLLGIDASFILQKDLEAISERIEGYIKAGTDITGDFILYFNDVPANIPSEKMKKIFTCVRNIRKGSL